MLERYQTQRIISLALITCLGAACTSDRTSIPDSPSLHGQYMPPSEDHDMHDINAARQQAVADQTESLLARTKQVKGPIARADYLISAYCDAAKLKEQESKLAGDRASVNYEIRTQAVEDTYENLAANDQVDTVDSFVLAAYEICPEQIGDPYRAASAG